MSPRPDRERIIQITIQIVEGMIAEKLVDPADDVALKEATRLAAQDARAVYFAALEHISG